MNHIESTIADLTAARDRADQLIQGLREFQSGIGGPSPAPGEFKAGDPSPLTPHGLALLNNLKQKVEHRTAAAGVRSLLNVSRGTAKQALRGRPPKHNNNVDAAVLHATCATLAEPFSALDLMKAAKAPYKQCNDYLRNRVGKQIFTRASRGAYRRGAMFNATPTKVRPPGDFIVGKGNRLPRDGQVKPPTPPSTAPAIPSINKPDTVVGAVKFLLRDEPDPFTRFEIAETLDADKDWQKLHATPEGKKALENALYQWTGRGYLTKTGGEGEEAFYKVTPAGREWMNQ